MYFSKLIRQDLCLGRDKGNADNCNFICIYHYIPNLELLSSASFFNESFSLGGYWFVEGSVLVMPLDEAVASMEREKELPVLAGKSTLNRIEHCPETVTSRAKSRYHRIGHDAEAIEQLLVEIFLESYSKAPREIILDLDVTDDLVHGGQEQAFFNPYYQGYCYAPLYIFCGKHLLVAKLRASNNEENLKLHQYAYLDF